MPLPRVARPRGASWAFIFGTMAANAACGTPLVARHWWHATGAAIHAALPHSGEFSMSRCLILYGIVLLVGGWFGGPSSLAFGAEAGGQPAVVAMTAQEPVDETV